MDPINVVDIRAIAGLKEFECESLAEQVKKVLLTEQSVENKRYAH